MYGQFQNQQNYQNQLQGYSGQNQFGNQQQGNGGNYLTPTEMRMYQQSHLSPMNQGFQNINQFPNQGWQGGTAFNSNRMQGQGETYVTPMEQRMYQHAGVSQPNMNAMSINQNQALAQNLGQSSAQFGGQFSQQRVGQAYNSNNLWGQGETYVTPTEQNMYQASGLQANLNQFSSGDISKGQNYITPTEQRMFQHAGVNPQFNQMGQMGQMPSQSGQGQLGQLNQMKQNYIQNENKGQYYNTPTEQRMYQNSGVPQFGNQFRY